MLKRISLVMMAFVLASCGQNPNNNHNNAQNQNGMNGNGTARQIDCTPITNPNYVPGGNQAQYYYPEGCQNPNGVNGNMNAQANNGSGVGGYVGAAAVGAAAGALASHAFNKNKANNVPTPANTPNTATARGNAPATMNTANQATARAAAPASMNRATATAPAFAPATVRPSAGIQNNRMSSRRR